MTQCNKVLTDIPVKGGNENGVIVFQQEYSIHFQSDTKVTQSTLGNLINRTKSGNPGYIFGRAVLGGKLLSPNADFDVISSRTGGLVLFGASGDGTCANSAENLV